MGSPARVRKRAWAGLPGSVKGFYKGSSSGALMDSTGIILGA